MDPLTYAIIVGGASMYSGYAGSEASKEAAEQANKAARESAFLQRLAGNLIAANTSAEVDLMIQEAELFLAEGGLEKAFREKENKKFVAAQKMAYIAGGIDLTGSPLLVIQESIMMGAIELDAFEASFKARAALMKSRAQMLKQKGVAEQFSATRGAGLTEAEGVQTSKAYESQALQQLIGGVSSAIKSFAGVVDMGGAGSVPTGYTSPGDFMGSIE